MSFDPDNSYLDYEVDDLVLGLFESFLLLYIVTILNVFRKIFLKLVLYFFPQT